MNKIKKLILIHLILFLSSCGTIKEGFKNQKKNSSDEFLVEKKSPLVMPPDYSQLPIPKTDKLKNNEEENSIKKLIITKEDSDSNFIEEDNKKNNIVKSMLDKIKNN